LLPIVINWDVFALGVSLDPCGLSDIGVGLYVIREHQFNGHLLDEFGFIMFLADFIVVAYHIYKGLMRLSSTQNAFRGRLFFSNIWGRNYFIKAK
jgi:hypothetical protein